MMINSKDRLYGYMVLSLNFRSILEGPPFLAFGPGQRALYPIRL
jgi:hypothetical protein